LGYASHHGFAERTAQSACCELKRQLSWPRRNNAHAEENVKNRAALVLVTEILMVAGITIGPVLLVVAAARSVWS
jgi:hypothetical protein